MTDDHRLKAKALVKKYLEGNCTEEEKALVEQWYIALSEPPNELTDKEAAADLLELQHRLSQIPGRKRRLTPYLQAAAAVILICMALWTLWNEKDRDKTTHEVAEITNDILPGGNRALLSLDGGQSIVLSEKKEGLIAGDGVVTYDDGTPISAIEKSRTVTISTPIAGQYHVTLPDGTHVWLNAKSSVTYPVQFDQNSRTVSITGEVYLDVSKNPNKPFIVNTGQQQIEVLGTSFNINAYGDDGRILTTLVEGSLRVTNLKFKSNALLKPGEQAEVSTSKNVGIKKVDIEEASSWKYGLFIINDEPLEKYARQIERWYDVDVDMQSEANTRISAIIPRNAKLSEVLQAIELKTGVKFEKEGRRIRALKQ